jgi:hypothetical protein
MKGTGYLAAASISPYVNSTNRWPLESSEGGVFRWESGPQRLKPVIFYDTMYGLMLAAAR